MANKQIMVDSIESVNEYIHKFDWRIKANANTDYSCASLINNLAGKTIANYWLNEVYSDKEGKFHKDGAIHIHDLDCLTGYCFTGDTKIKLLNGTEKSFKELVNEYSDKKFWVYSSTVEGSLVPGLAHSPRITRKNSELVKIILDNDECIKCTPDHPFMLRNGSYKQAKDLNINDSLMPLYYGPLGGYEIFFDNINNRKNKEKDPLYYVHRTILENKIGRKLEKGEQTHHIDGNKLNNNPDNLQMINESVHKAFEIRKTRKTEKWKKANKEAATKVCQSAERIAIVKEYSRIHNSPRNRSDKQRACVSYGAVKNKKYCEKERYIEHVKNNKYISYKEFENTYNHKVKEIVKLNYKEDVYDITVEKYHNFALSAGVFVHNCAGWSLRQLLDEGFNGVQGRTESTAPTHFETALGQMVNFFGILQSEWAGAQAFSSFDTYLAPYLFKDKLSYKELKRELRRFIHSMNVPSRWGQSPFTNITIDWTVPDDLSLQFPTRYQEHLFKDLNDFKLLEIAKERDLEIESLDEMCYKHFQPEMDIINKAFYEILTEGDAKKQPFTFPIPTVNITEDFDWDTENAQLLFHNAATVGSSYFQNFIGSQYKIVDGKRVKNEKAINPSDVRSMCMTYDTYVYILENNKYVPGKKMMIGDLLENYDINNFKISTPHGFRSIERKIITNTNKLIKITTTSGKELKVTPDHPSIIYGKQNSLIEIRSDQLKIGMKVSVKYNSLGKNNGNYNNRWNDDQKKKLSEKIKIKYKNNPNMKLMGSRNPMFGKKHSNESLDKISKSCKGHFVSESCKEKSRERWIGLKNPISKQEYWDRKDFENNNRQISPDEQKIFDVLESLNIKFQFQKVFNDKINNKSFISDFFIPEKNLVIECESYLNKNVIRYNQYKTPVSEHYEKTNFYKENNINLLVLNGNSDFEYWANYVNTVEEIISVEEIYKNCKVYDIELGYEEGQKEIHLFYANDIVTHNCCRLQLDLTELKRRGNGLFGSSELTGSIGVVTINMARLGYLYKGNMSELLKHLDELLYMSKDILERKREFITEMYDRGLYPYTKRYLKSLNNHFSTVGVNGINELIRNYTNNEHDISSVIGKQMTLNLLDHIREKIFAFQKDTGNLYNLEATPAEGACYRFAKEDKKRYKGIIQAGFGDKVYYTNSSQLPVHHTDDIFEALLHQDEIQCKYTGGTVFHLYMKERISSDIVCKELIRKVISNFRIPYITITPIFSICPTHGYLNGEHEYCPMCDEELLKERLRKNI